MVHKPKVPMLPQEVPQQRLTIVEDLPDRPPGFQGRLHYKDPLPPEATPKGSPRNKLYLGAVEWAFSPASSRFDAYYLNSRGAYWLLWNYELNENLWVPRREWAVYGYGPRRGVGEREAAVYLLMDAWKADGVGHYFMIDDTGFLSVEEISAMARVVWPDEAAESE